MGKHEYVINNRNVEDFEVEDVCKMIRDGVLNGYVAFVWADYPFEDQGFGNSYSFKIIIDFDGVTFERVTNGYMPKGWDIVGQTGRWVDYEYRRIDEYKDNEEWVEHIVSLTPYFMSLAESASFFEADEFYTELLNEFGALDDE